MYEESLHPNVCAWRCGAQKKNHDNCAGLMLTLGEGGKKRTDGKKKKKRKKNFPPGRGPGFSLIFMKKNFPQNREDMSKKGSKKIFSRSARKGPFISRKYVMTWDGNVHQEPNQPFSHVFPRQALALGSL